MVESHLALRNTLRRLADWQAPNAIVISAYLDLRPGGENPAMRPAQVVLRDRLREIERSYQEHTPEHAAFTADAERINTFIDERLPNIAGLALFAGAGLGFETAETRIELENEVSLAPYPVLLPLARLADSEQAVVALADTNTLRIFVHRSGALEEVGLVDDEPDDYSKTEAGGWSQARFQRHVQEHREAFARLAVEAIGEIVELESAQVLLIAADDVAMPVLRDELPKPLAAIFSGSFNIDMRATIREVEAQALPLLAAVRAEAAADAADRLV